MDDLSYIKSNFIDQHKLCKVTNISLEKLNELIENKLLPDASYKIKVCTKITSSLGDKKELNEIIKYFHKSSIDFIKNNMNKNSKEFKAQIKKKYIKSLIKHDTDNVIYKSKNELDPIFESKWNYFINGVYGICTLNSTPEEIAKKGIVVQRLIDRLEEKKNLPLKDRQNKLVNLNNAYNEVATIFAPYQRKNSTRGKYLDTQLKKDKLEHLIKKYE